MQRSHSITATDHEIATTVLCAWLALGLFAMLISPSARAHDPVWGWLPFWLVAAPLLDLALLHRRRLLAALRMFLVRARRHRPVAPRQARRWRRGAATRLPHAIQRRPGLQQEPRKFPTRAGIAHAVR